MSLLQDLRHGARHLAARPAFALTTLLSLSLGIGVNAAVFSAANTLLIQPMHLPRAGELVRVYRGHHSPFTFAEYAWLRARTRAMSGLVAETVLPAAWSTGNEPEAARVGLMSGNAFAALEVVPARGRLFVRRDDLAPAASPEVVLSHAFWTSRLGGDTAIVGRTIRLNDRPFQVIGVAPPEFASSQAGWGGDLFVAIGDLPALNGQSPQSIQGSLYVTGRLARGETPATAAAEMSVLAGQLMAQDPSRYREFTIKVRPARGVTEEVRATATMGSAFLLGVSLLILVIAATNVGNMLLARHAARRREIAVRLALGASRGGLVRMLAAESAVLAGVAGTGAYVLAAWTGSLLGGLIPSDAGVVLDFAPDWRVTAYTTTASAAALLIFGLLPAVQSTRLDVAEAIKAGAAVGPRSGARLRRRFLMVQVGLSCVLLSLALLFARSLGRARNVALGFEPAGVLVASVDLSARGLSREAGITFHQRLLEAVRALPGVSSATWSRVVELTGSNSATEVYRPGDDEEAVRRRNEEHYVNTVGPGYHGTLGIPLVKGRDFADTDVTGAPLVVIVNETFAARTWPGEDPIGKRISTDGPSGPWREVIGLSRNAKYHTLGEGPKMFFSVPFAQEYDPWLWLEARVADGASAREVGTAIGRLVKSLDPALPAPRVQGLTEMQRVVLMPAKVGAGLLGGIGLLAVVLAAVGIAGVASYTVSQCRREIGVRMALGAPPAALLRSILRETWRSVAVGGAVGLGLSVVAARLVASQLYGLPFADPVTFTAVPLLLVAMSALATLAPSRRAMGVSPAEALRQE